LPPADERGVTKPAIIFSLVAVAVLLFYSLTTPIFIPQGFYQNGGFQPGISFTLIVFLILALNPIARFISSGRGMRPGNLTLIFVLTFATGSLASTSMTQYFYPLIIQIVYKQSPQNRWGEFLEHIPSRLLPSKDPESIVVSRLWEGLREGESIPWGEWVVPLLTWTVFFGLFFLLLFCLAVIVRRQLVERELLDFPMVRPALEVLRKSENDPEQPCYVGGKAFWIAFVVMMLITTIESGNLPFYAAKFGPKIPVVGHAMGQFFDNIPKPRFSAMSGNVFGYKPWNALNRTVFLWIPSFIALFYLLPAEASFSVWFFYLLNNKVVPVIAAASGVTLKQPGGNQDYEYLRDMTKGGLYVFMGMFLWNARSHLRAVFRRAVFGDKQVKDDDEPVPYRFAFFGAVFGFVGIVAWCAWNGMAWYYAAIFLTIMLVIITYYVKQTGEMTLPHAKFNDLPQDHVNTFVGASMVAKGNMVMGHLMQMVIMFEPPVLMAHLVQGFKVAGDMKLRKRLLGPCLLAAFLIGIVVTHVTFLGLAYPKGIGNNIRHGHRVYMEQFGNKLTQQLSSEETTDWAGTVLAVAGGAVVAGLMILKQHLIWWPFTPIGFIASTFSWVFQTWFMFFIAWALKYTVIKLGGPRTYLKSLPIVFGIMIGNGVAGFIWGLVKLIYELNVA